MKRRFCAIASFILALIMSLSIFGGCNLITIDNERDMNQVIATVRIDDSINTDICDIYKRELVMSYINYGYYYTQNYGMSEKETFEFLLTDLIEMKIMLQSAMKDFDAGKYGATVNTEYNKWEIKRYLTIEEITESEYLTRKDIDDLIDSYEYVEEVPKYDSLTDEVRTVPTGATVYEKELSFDEQKEYNNKPFDTDSTKERRDAFNSVINLFEANGFVGDDYDGTIESTKYYKEILNSYLENKLITKYQNLISAETRNTYTFEDLEEKFNKTLNDQKEYSVSNYVTALEGASASSPILYSKYGTYGYVYNLLLGASDAQAEDIGEIDKKLPSAEKEKLRKEILKDVTIKDLRSTWILSGYDFDGTKFTHDYTLTKDSANSLKFYGEVKEIKAATDEDSAKYTVTSVKSFGLDEFIAEMNAYLYGTTGTYKLNQDQYDSVYATYTASGLDREVYEQKINELLFAFSTDGGSLNTYKGYLVKPAVDGSETEQYVTSFADAGRELLTGKYGENGYIIVASDFGYHVMFYSQVLQQGYQAATNLVEYLNLVTNSNYDRDYWVNQFNAMLADWVDYEDTDSYLYLLANTVSSHAVEHANTTKQTEILNEYKFENKSYTTFEKAYKDLVG